MVDGKRINYGDIGVAGKDPLAGAGGMGVMSIGGAGAVQKKPGVGVPSIGELGPGLDMPDEKALSIDAPVSTNPVDITKSVPPVGAGFAEVDGKRIEYGDTGVAGKDPLAGAGGIGVMSIGGAGAVQKNPGVGVPSIGELGPGPDMPGGKALSIDATVSTNPVNITQSVPPVGAGFAEVDGKRIEYGDIGVAGKDPLAGAGGIGVMSIGGAGAPQKKPGVGVLSIGELGPGPDMPGGKALSIDAPLNISSAGLAKPTPSTGDAGTGTVGKGPVSDAEYREQVAQAVRVNAANGFAPTLEQIKTLGISNADVVNILSANNKKGQFDKQIVAMQTQQGVDQTGKKLENESKALTDDLEYKRSLLSIDTPLKTAQARNFQAEAEYRDWLRTPEGARQAGKELPADARMVGYLVDNGIAKDPKQAWSMLKTAKTDPVGVVSSLVGDMESRQQKLGILPTDPRYKDRDTMISEASDLVKRVQGQTLGEERGQPASKPKRNVAPLRDFFGRNSKRPMNELIVSAQRQGWNDEEIREVQRSGGQAPSSSQPQPTRSPTAAAKATLSGNGIVFQGKSYPLNPDGTVTIDGRKFRVQQ